MSWKIDPAHTHIEFRARHMMVTWVRGHFGRFEGVVEFDPSDPAATRVDIQIEAASLDTREPSRDAHLRSADFLDAENHPYITFASRRVEVQDGSNARLIGDLTIRGISREVVLDVEFNGLLKNPYGQEVAGFNAWTKINRKDWNLTWNVALETGGVLVGDEIAINVEMELVKQPVGEDAAVSAN